MDLIYAKEKLDTARSKLMLPHPDGEAASIASAFLECSLGLGSPSTRDMENVIPHARDMIAEIDDFMDTTAVQDPDGRRGLYLVKAEGFTDDEKYRLSFLINELCCLLESPDS